MKPFLVAVTLLTVASAGAHADTSCFPSCAADDGRMLSLSSNSGAQSLLQSSLEIRLSVKKKNKTFSLGFFDGDSGLPDASGVGHWEFSASGDLSLTLYADPMGDGTGNTVVGQWSGNSMPDNEWSDATIQTGPEARQGAGPYRYRLAMEYDGEASYFKVRTTAEAFFTPYEVVPIVARVDANSASIIYPAFPSAVPTTYDGTFDLLFSAGEPPTEFVFWNGDADMGDPENPDTDDQDTPNNSLPPFASHPGTLFEGAGGLGIPQDGVTVNTSNEYLYRPGLSAVVTFPPGLTLTDDNPSGNREWEQVRIEFGPPETALTSFAGLYEVTMLGLDMNNTLLITSNLQLLFSD